VVPSTPSEQTEPRSSIADQAHRPWLRTTLVGLLAAVAGAVTAIVLGVPVAQALICSSATGAAAVLFVALGGRSRLPPSGEAKLDSDPLGDELGRAASAAEVIAALERAVQRAVACDEVRLVLDPATPPAPGAARIRLPLDGRDEFVGVLEVGAPRSGGVFAPDEVRRLEAIARQAGAVLSYALACERLELERRQQAAVWRGEREALVETVAAEIAHEVRYSINFFRCLFDVGPGPVALTAEQAEVGREEVERLERLVSGLRRSATHRIERRSVSLIDLCARARAVLRDTLQDRKIVLDGPAGLTIRCDVDQATQILVNLLANALEATQQGGEVGVRWRAIAEGLELVVWDTGPGYMGDPAALFAPWYTTKERGSGLGLAITHRLARAHGWEVNAMRGDGVTSFVVSISAADLLDSGESRGTKRAVA
jgi:two-component system sensor histidine kinase HydH